jgi:hypothetical protein
MDEFESLRCLDRLIKAYEEAGHAPSAKELRTLRAWFVYDLAPLNTRPLVYPPIVMEEVE